MATLERAELVGKGFCADVYAWGAGRVLKLFHGSSAPERAEREFAATRAVHSAGLPAPAAYDVIEVEGRSGIVFERIDGVSLFDHVQARTWKLFAAVRRTAELHSDIHRHAAPDGLPSLRDRIAARIEESDAPEPDKRAARDRLASLPDGTALCHGDFHPGNVLLSARPGRDRLERGQPGAPARRRRLHVPTLADGVSSPVGRLVRDPLAAVTSAGDAPLVPEVVLPTTRGVATGGRGLAGTARGRGPLVARAGHVLKTATRAVPRDTVLRTGRATDSRRAENRESSSTPAPGRGL